MFEQPRSVRFRRELERSSALVRYILLPRAAAATLDVPTVEDGEWSQRWWGTTPLANTLSGALME
jgi:hypothetical protein